MRAALNKMLRALYMALLLAPLACLAGYGLLPDYRLGLKVYALCALLALALTLLPGKIRKFPLRATLTVGLVVLIPLAFMLLSPEEIFWLKRLGFGALMAVAFALFVRENVSVDEAIFGGQGTMVGMVIYLIAGIALFVLKDAALNGTVGILLVAFLFLAGFMMNGESLLTGHAARQNTRPPRAMVKANRLMVLLLAAVVAFAALFDTIRRWVVEVLKAAVRGVLLFLNWLSNLFATETVEQGVESGESGGLPAMPAGESAPFWDILYKIALVLVGILLAFLLYKGARILWKKIVVAWRFLLAKFRGFTQAVSEDYRDEQVSLMSADEMRKAVEEGLRKRINKLFSREKRWEKMDNRERVRSVVKGVYRRTGDSVAHLQSLTVREAAPRVNIGRADPEILADLYERARYGGAEPTSNEAEDLRKAVK